MKRTVLMDSIYSQLFPAKLSKSDHRKIQILEAAIRTYAALGIEYVSYEDIAREAGASRPLIQHYFPEKRDLFQLAMKFIRAQFQDLAIKRMQAARGGPKEVLEEYVRSTFVWVRDYPVHSKVWLFFFFLAASDKKLRAEHRVLTEMGSKRIVALLEQGVGTGAFAPGDLVEKSKAIQQIITGALIELVTERERSDLETMAENAVKACLWIVEKKS